MPEHPPSGASHGPGASGFPSPPTEIPGAQGGPPPWPSAPPRGLSRWPTFLALAIAVIATGLAIVGWFRPTPPPPAPHPAEPTYTQQQISDAKARACKAFEAVLEGRDSTDCTGNQAVTATMRKAQAIDGQLSLVAGGWYLRDHVEPATPKQLGADMRKTADVLLDLGANALAGAQNADQPQADLLTEAQSAFAQVQELCK